MSENVQYPPAETFQSKPKKKKRIFMWFFIAVNLIFLIMFIAGVSSGGSNAEECAGQVTEFFTQADCEAARGIGTGLGAFALLIGWAIVDFILFIVWAVKKLSSR